jgi:hypothetical protein
VHKRSPFKKDTNIYSNEIPSFNNYLYTSSYSTTLYIFISEMVVTWYYSFTYNVDKYNIICVKILKCIIFQFIQYFDRSYISHISICTQKIFFMNLNFPICTIIWKGRIVSCYNHFWYKNVKCCAITTCV